MKWSKSVAPAPRRLLLGIGLALCALVAPGAAARAAGPSANESRVKPAVERGLRFLRDAQKPDGTWPGPGNSTLGPTALAGLALLECGAPADDDRVRKAADYARKTAPRYAG